MSESNSIPMRQTVISSELRNAPDGDGPKAVTAPAEPSAIRQFLQNKSAGKLPDGAFSWLMLVCALSIFVIVLLIVFVLIRDSRLSIHAFGWKFFTGTVWDPVSGDFGALPFIYGTVVSSLLAIAMAVPLALLVAIFVLEICPNFLRGPISFLTELLAAIPSVVYGLWGVFVLVPLIRDQVGPVLEKTLGWTGLFAEPNFGVGMFTAAVILAIMIFPVISSISRDVMRVVPPSQREAALALGATRWEMIRISVLRNSRIGIVGSVILGLGRALGETMAVTMVIGNHPDMAKNLLAPGYTLASVIANEFTEATGDLYLSALIEIGLALFLVTIVVNAIARLLVWAVTRNNAAGAH
ncbi:phosphate ABC transporter permease subunit PstC [Granulicella sp. 5B5]|uniref:phosphate ABC transporter permease subunit PstC n=1 Tax=Granulicella sp. 5B5 TaxID=1617967 RepID=UPI0015F46FDA|nr:phosphate ABC transporter permease subunit PstC [Granulicella sp. 5B5]QMV19385.1 phosphate ABC transporter permease subunit PstC [Granulicella sp. 5B5]